MKLPRRQFLHLAAGAVAVPAVSRIAWAQAYPARTITLIVPFPAGGATDVVARALAKGLSERLGQSVVIDNRPGANGAIGTASVAKARPDGYTLVMGGVNTHAMNDSLIKPSPYNSARDFAPITLTALIPIAFVVNPQLPVTTLQDLVALARSKPRQLSYGSSGTGSPHHLAMELFKLKAGIDIVHVPYKGGAPQLNDLMGGHILIGSIGLPPALPHIETGKLRALAGTEAKRSVFLPKIPTVAESRLPRFRSELLAWAHGTSGHASRHHRPARRRKRGRPDKTGYPRDADQAGRRRRDQLARRVQDTRRDGHCQMVQGRPGHRHHR